MARKKNPDYEDSPDKQIVDECNRRLEESRNSAQYTDWHQRAKDAMRFRALDQWDARIKNQRENDPDGARPCLVVDKINQHFNQVRNDIRMTRPAIRISPVDSGADPETAEMLQDLIRHIEYQSTTTPYDTASDNAIEGGFGYFRISTRWVKGTFQQEIRLLPIHNRFTVFPDPSHREVTAEDQRYCHVCTTMKRAQFKAEHPDAKGSTSEKKDEDDIEVIEYYRLSEQPQTLHLLPDGRVHVGELPAGVQAMRSRTEPMSVVEWYKIADNEILERTTIPGEFVPVVQVIGDLVYDDKGEWRPRGLIEPAMDSQRMHNYASSAFVEQVGLAPRAPWVAATGQVQQNRESWADANRRNIAVLEYEPVEVNGVMVPAPQRTPPPGIPVGWQAVLQNTEHDVMASLGRYNANLGNASNETSGRAITARQRQGDIGNFHFIDNLSKSIAHGGRILVSMVPKVYEPRRVVRIRGEDGETREAIIDRSLQTASQPVNDELSGEEIGRLYNPDIGRYDVTVSVGPSYATKRQESADSMLDLAKFYPPLMQIAGDKVVKNLDWPEADDIAARIEATIPENIREPKKTQGPNAPDPMQQMAMMAQAQKMQAELSESAAKAEEANQKAREAKAKADKAEAEAMQARAQIMGMIPVPPGEPV